VIRAARLIKLSRESAELEQAAGWAEAVSISLSKHNLFNFRVFQLEGVDCKDWGDVPKLEFQRLGFETRPARNEIKTRRGFAAAPDRVPLESVPSYRLGQIAESTGCTKTESPEMLE
jgi:hypothetical protein